MEPKRKRYTNEILDITIIELLENDNIKHFLSLDKKILDKINIRKDDSSSISYFNNILENESIYLLNYILNNNRDEVFTSYGLINKIDGNEVKHKCYTGLGSSGSPILLLETKKVIGIHFAGTISFNLGLLLIKPLIEFQNITSNLLVIKKNEGNNNSRIIIENKNNNIRKTADKIYNDLKNYFVNEENVKNILNNKANQKYMYQGFLVDKIWVDNWKQYSNYDFIKTNYLFKDIKDENAIKNMLINYLSNNNINYDKIIDVENYILKDINQLKLKENLKKSFVLLGLNFLKAFLLRINITPISFHLFYQNIEIIHQNLPIFSF